MKRSMDRVDLKVLRELQKVVQHGPATEHRLTEIESIEVQDHITPEMALICLVLVSEKTGRVGYMVPFMPGNKPDIYVAALLSYVDQHEQFRTSRKHRREIERLVLKKAEQVATRLADDIIASKFVEWYGYYENGSERMWVSDYVDRGKMTYEQRRETMEYIMGDLDDRSLLTSEIEKALPRIFNV